MKRGNEYRRVYTMPCLDARNNVAVLVDRHASGVDAENLEVMAFGDGNPMGLQPAYPINT